MERTMVRELTGMIFFIILILLMVSCDVLYNYDKPEIDGVPNVYIYMSESNIDRLRESVYFGDTVECVCTIDDVSYPAEIKIRGNVSRTRSKKSYTIIIHWPEGPVSYAFTGSSEASGIRNRLAFETYRDLGVYSPDSEFAALFINNKYVGLYTSFDIYTRRDILDYYSGSSLELYKCSFSNIGYDFPLQDTTEKKIPDDDNFYSLIVLLQKMNELSDDDWNRWVEENFDVEQTARYFAVHNFLAVTDTKYKNYYIAVIDGKYLFLPWDNENCMRPNTIRFSSAEYYPFDGDMKLEIRLLKTGSPVRDRYEELLDQFFFDDNEYVNRIRARIDLYTDQVNEAQYYDNMDKFSYDIVLGERDIMMQFLDERESEFP